MLQGRAPWLLQIALQTDRLAWTHHKQQKVRSALAQRFRLQGLHRTGHTLCVSYRQNMTSTARVWRWQWDVDVPSSLWSLLARY
jgi:hypothetical protein